MTDLSDRLRRRAVRPLPERSGPAGVLADLAPGARALVVGLHPDDATLARRLCDLGFTPGTVVEVLRRAPLGDPAVYRLRDYEICLRERQARAVDVEVLD